MRAGICSVPQALTAEAASIVKQALSLARRRGHAQVTPLHVASAMLASSAGLLRRACLQSHSHPLQCKALELCFNVALNRLPSSTSSALLGPQSSYPSLSNALVAAFKRAQAHQRRGSIENQQQPILALKIEIEQLIISILDDPSVSRVMREAGFSSTQVKSKVEQAVSLEISSQTNTPVSSQSNKETISTKPHVLGATMSHQSLPFNQFGLTLSKPLDNQVKNDDVVSVLNSIVSKKRNIVVTGECLASAESVVRGVMDKFERGHVPGDLRSARFISLPLISLRNHSKDEVEQKLVELRCIVKSYMNRGVVLYLGDFKWVSDFWSINYGEQRTNYYSTVEHVIMELKRLVRGISTETGRLWLMGIATFQTYMKCKAGHPSLETIWELYPFTIPVGSLSLSLNLDSVTQSKSRSKFPTCGSSWPLLESGVDNHLAYCTDCSVNFNGEAQSIASSIRNKESTAGITISTSSSLPSWLLQYKEENERNKIGDKECTNVSDICKKWNSFCDSVHEKQHYPEKTIKFASSPPSPISVSSNEHNTNLSWPVIFQPKRFPKEHQIWMSEGSNEGYESNLRNDPKPDLLSNPNSSPNSASSSEALDDMEGLQSFKVFNADNLKILCCGLEKKVPWQKDIIPEIANTILECRSGMSKRKSKLNHREDKEETWLFFLGVDFEGKEKIARELARLVFGSQSNFVSIGLSNFSSTRADSIEESKKKRKRDELSPSYAERFGLALNENPHRVFLMEDVEQVDYFSQKEIKRAIENGSVTLPAGENVPLKDAIIIFSESFSSVSRACSPPIRQKNSDNEHKDDEDIKQEKKPVVSLDLNIAIEGENGDEYSVTENGILESVDRQIIFKIQELS